MEVILELERIYYTRMSELLVTDYLKMYNNAKIQEVLYGKRKEFTDEQILNWIHKCLEQNYIIFSLIEKSTKNFIGIIEIPSNKNNIGEIAIALTPNKQNKGYGFEAINTILKYGYEVIGLVGFELYVFKLNQKAIGCYSKTGFEMDHDGYTKDDVHMKHVKQLKQHVE